MRTTSNASKLASLRQCEFSIDLSLNSGEQDTVKIMSGEGSKMGGGRVPSFSSMLENNLEQCTKHNGILCNVYTNSLVAFPLAFAAAVNTRPGMKAFPPLADLSAPPPPRRHHLATLGGEVLMLTSNTDTPHCAVKYAK